MTDPVGDMLVGIKNGYMAKKAVIFVPFSKHKFEVVKILAQRKFIASANQENKSIKIELLYDNQKPALSEIKRMSKPGLRVYIKSKNIRKIKSGKGTLIISTPQGIFSGEDAKTKKLGGEVICKLW